MKRRRQQFTNLIRLFVEFAFSSGAGQALGMLSGFIYVRVMSVNEYGIYGLCLTTLTFVNLTSDFGLTGSTTYFWRLSRQSEISFSPYLNEIKKLRKWLFGLSALVASAILYQVGEQRRMDWAVLTPTLIAVLVTAFAMIDFSIRQQVLRLAGAYRISYAAEFSGQITRLFFALAMLAGAATSAMFGIVGGMTAAVITALIAARFEIGIESRLPKGEGTVNPRSQVLRYVIPVAPSVALFALQDSAIMWMAAAKGGPQVIAEVFALGRISAIIALIASFIVAVVVPRVSGISDDARFNRVSWMVRCGLAISGILLVSFATLFPNQILWLIGKNYGDLHSELILVVATGSIALFYTGSALLNRARGWVRFDPLAAIIQGVVMIILALQWSFDSAWQVLLLILIGSCFYAASSIIVGLAGLMNPPLMALKMQNNDAGN